MEDFLQQIEKALDFNLYYIALQSTLTLPDICGALESQNGESTKSKYFTWFNKYFKGDVWLTDKDCYFFRCANVHQAKTIHKNSKYSRILFIEPQTVPITMHNCIIEDALCIDVNIFCRDMISSVRDWLNIIKNDTTFQNNYATFIKRYPNGISPYISGAPVIS